MFSSTFSKIVVVCLMSLTGSLAVGPAAVNLGAAGNFVILAEASISCVPPCAVTGNIGLSPAASTFLTGWSLIRSADGTSSSSTQDTGLILSADCTSPTPATLTAAIEAFQEAFNDAAGRSNPTATNLGAGAIGGLTFTGGLYKWTTGVSIGSAITFSGSSTDTWIFQIAGTLSLARGIPILLAGGALPKNIVFVVSGAFTFGSASTFNGILLGAESIACQVGATVHGRLFSMTSVSLQKCTVVGPT